MSFILKRKNTSNIAIKPQILNFDLDKSSTRYIFDNNKGAKELPKLYSKKDKCCGCGSCFAVCPMSGGKRPAKAYRNSEGTVCSEGENFSIKYNFLNSDIEETYMHTGAITMLPDSEGFKYPVVDAEICIRCYKCVDVCPIR